MVQIPIEHIGFPPVTLCPIGKTNGDNEDDDDDDEKDVENTDIPYDSLKSAVIACSFTKNNVDTGKVCDRIQVTFDDKNLIRRSKQLSNFMNGEVNEFIKDKNVLNPNLGWQMFQFNISSI